jgi:cobalt-zinc-cadmium efflux system membrane fusion protein
MNVLTRRMNFSGSLPPIIERRTMKMPKIVLWPIAIVAVVVGGAIAMQHGPDSFAGRIFARLGGDGEKKKARPAQRVEVVAGQPETIRFSDEAFQTLAVRTVEVEPAPPPDPLRLPGSLMLDPNRLVRVHSRFTGELVRIGTVGENSSTRTLRYGDKVKRGDVLAIVWSKEIGEKKSELVDAVSKLASDEKVLKAYESVLEGAIPKKTIVEQRRNVEADVIAQAKAERTLRSWSLTEAQMAAIYREADEVRRQQVDTTNDKSWAELEIKAPIDGMIIEKNFNEGSMVDPDDDLFQIADLSQLLVLANVYEEDLPALRKLEPGHRNWLVDLKSDPHDQPRKGTFDLFGTIIDPTSHTGVVMGWLDNSKENLAAGQFITATVALPADPHLVTIPSTALIEQGDASYVFVESNAARHEFTRRKVAVKRRWRHSIHVCRDSADAENACGADSLEVGERVIVSGVLEFSAELDAAKSRSAEQENDE